MRSTGYSPAIRLDRLVASVGVEGVRRIVEGIGALRLEPKANQEWRYVYNDAVIIGHRTAVVIAGRDALAMRRAENRLLFESTLEPVDHYLPDAYDLAVDARKLAASFAKGREVTAEAGALVKGAAGPDMDFIADDALEILRTYDYNAAQWFALVLAIYRQGADDGYTLLIDDYDDEAGDWEDEPADDEAPTPEEITTALRITVSGAVTPTA